MERVRLLFDRVGSMNAVRLLRETNLGRLIWPKSHQEASSRDGNEGGDMDIDSGLCICLASSAQCHA